MITGINFSLYMALALMFISLHLFPFLALFFGDEHSIFRFINVELDEHQVLDQMTGETFVLSCYEDEYKVHS